MSGERRALDSHNSISLGKGASIYFLHFYSILSNSGVSKLLGFSQMCISFVEDESECFRFASKI